jgi:hypothetical protein
VRPDLSGTVQFSSPNTPLVHILHGFRTLDIAEYVPMPAARVVSGCVLAGQRPG